VFYRGAIAEQGKIDYDLLSDLNSIDYYQMTYPKSLGREWINEAFWFRVRESEASKEDKMKTLVDHIAEQIANNIEQFGADDPALTRVFVSGGGAFNKTLIDHLRSHTEVEIIIPEEDVIMYKEALIFALLGVLRVRNEINVYASATGAEKNSVSGSLHGNFSQLIG
jgi:anhydro-N-acetylmuramic acid kinase